MSSKKHTSARSVAQSAQKRRVQPSAKQGTPSFLPWVILGLVIIVGAAGLLVTSSAARSSATSTVADSANVGSLPPEISVAQAAAKRDAGAFMLDVRQPEEWVEYHMPGSTLIPLGELAARVAEVPRDREIVVVCRSGNRSQEGRDILTRAGFTRVTSMAGGLREWRAQGYPTVSGR